MNRWIGSALSLAPKIHRTNNLRMIARSASKSAASDEAFKKRDKGMPNVNDSDLPVTFEDIVRARFRIQSGISKTEVRFSHALSVLCKTNVYLKCDLNLYTGSFKERGARNALMSLSPAEAKGGVISASAGNHALAMCYHGRQLGVPVTVVMPKNAPLTKISRCRQFGANVILHGEHIIEARDYAFSNHPELKYINGYNDVEIVAGAGSMGIEILEQVPQADVIIVPVGGAGLIAGVSLAVKTLKGDQIEVISAEPENCASFAAAIEAGKPVYAFKNPTLADGLAVPVVGEISFQIARRFVDSCHAVNELNIAQAVLRLLEMEKIVAEGGGATGLAAILPGGPLYGKYEGKNVVIPLCGGNIDTTVMHRVIERGLAADQRIIRFSVTVTDRPGGIAMLTARIFSVGGSIKDIYHERAWVGSIDKVNITVVVETTGADHTKALYEELEKEYKVNKLDAHH